MQSSRRRFLQWSAVAAAATVASRQRDSLSQEDRPQVTRPRATSGDTRSEPDWSERLEITVGPGEADIVGTSQRAIQAAVEYVARLGGGTVRLLPGKFVLRNAIQLQSKVRLVGSGEDTLITKPASHSTKLTVDSDWFDQEITLSDARGFQVGDAICLRTKNPHTGSTTIAKRTLVARDGQRFKLDRALRENFWLMGDTTVSSLFPLVTAENAQQMAIESLVLDGNRAQNENLDGNYAGCIFMQDCADISFKRVTARHYNGDGISWQICHDVIVEDCHSHDHAGLGLHPGSGSQRPIMRRNRLERNHIGLFFCWGVKFGLAEHNVLDGNRIGISLGHRDTDNWVRNNEVLRSGEVGVVFRPERGPAFAAHRNRIETNRIVDTGGDGAAAIDVQGGTESVSLKGNQLEETRNPAQRIGIRLGSDTRDIRVEDNTIKGFARDVVRVT